MKACLENKNAPSRGLKNNISCVCFVQTRSSRPAVFLEKGILKICRKFTR